MGTGSCWTSAEGATQLPGHSFQKVGYYGALKGSYRRGIHVFRATISAYRHLTIAPVILWLQNLLSLALRLTCTSQILISRQQF